MDLQALLHPSLLWFIAGVVLMFLELTAPGFIIFFFGLGCWLTAGIMLVWDLSLTQQIIIFLTTTIISILLLRKMLVQAFRGRADSMEVSDYDDFPKQAHVKVLKNISPKEQGRISFRGSSWNATADEFIAEGETVELIEYADESRMIFKVRKI